MNDKTIRTDDEWRRLLTEEQFEVCRCKGTEAPFSGEYWDNKEPGVYRCVCCGVGLFGSESKFDSGSGWPSFWQPVAEQAVATQRDTGHGMVRTEVLCHGCGAHLGHVFSDGPPPTGLRYCINSAALRFMPEKT